MATLTRANYDRFLHAAVAVCDVRKMQRALRLPSTGGSLLEAIQRHTSNDVCCMSCRGSGGYGDDHHCLACRGTGTDRDIPIARLYDRYRDHGRKVLCSLCLESTHSETSCEHCGQSFVRATAQDGTLLSLAQLSLVAERDASLIAGVL